MLIYTPKITSRIQYSFQLVFDSVWQIDYQLTEDVEFFLSHQGAKLNYSNKQLSDECFIKAYGLLSEKGILDILLPLKQEATIYSRYRWKITTVLIFILILCSVFLDQNHLPGQKTNKF